MFISSKLSGFFEIKIFAVTYLQLSVNHVKIHVNCVKKSTQLLSVQSFIHLFVCRDKMKTAMKQCQLHISIGLYLGTRLRKKINREV